MSKLYHCFIKLDCPIVFVTLNKCSSLNLKNRHIQKEKRKICIHFVQQNKSQNTGY